MPTRYPLGAIPSPPDPRDYRVMMATPYLAADLPPKYLIGQNQAVRNQDGEGTCVGHALASGVMGQLERAKGYERTLSVRDAYEGARMVELTVGEGAHPRAALKYAQKTGLCLEADWPYHVDARGTPGPQAEVNRACNRIASYAQVRLAVPDIKVAMQHFGPLMIVIPVTEGFFDPDERGLVKESGAHQGFHAVTLIGWDDVLRAYRLRNSWGEGWGQGGYCWLPYSHPITEAWSVTPSLTATPQPPAPTRPWWLAWWPWW